MTPPRFTSFREFFPFYLGEHADPRNRMLHYIGTSAAILLLVLTLTVGPWWLIFFLGPVGYGPAWVGHFIIEKNRPATFTYPLWSLMGDFVMLGLFLTGRLGARLEAIRRAP